MKYGITTVRAWNSVEPEKVIHVHRADFRLVKSILFNLYLFEGMSRKDASLLSSRDAARGGPYSVVKKSAPKGSDEWLNAAFDSPQLNEKLFSCGESLDPKGTDGGCPLSF